MKAKEWVDQISKTPYEDEEFMSLSLKLLDECDEILVKRVSGIKAGRSKFGGDDFQDRMINAYREAHVKWDAVCHGVHLRIRKPGEEQNIQHWPLVRGFLLLKHILASLESEALSDIEKAEVVMMYQGFAEKLGYMKDPAFIMAFKATRDETAAAIAKEIRMLETELSRIRVRVLFGTVDMKLATRSMEIRRRLNHLMALTDHLPGDPT